MDRDLLNSVTEFTQRLRREQATLVRAMDRAREVRDGTDESGAITILIDDEGTARDVRVATDWRRRLGPARIGAAVVAADGEAARRRASATAEALARQSTADVEGTEEPEESAQDGLVAPATAVLGRLGALGPESPAGPAPDPTRPHRPLTEITDAVLAAFDDLERVTEPPPPVHGAGAGGAVRVTLAQGRIAECVINQAWLAQQDEVTLAHALREAVSAAATAGVAARRPLIDFQQRLTAIVADAHASLSQGTGGARP